MLLALGTSATAQTSSPGSPGASRADSTQTTIGGYDHRSPEQLYAEGLKQQQAKLAYEDAEKDVAEGRTLDAIKKYRLSIEARPSVIYNTNAYQHLGDAYSALSRYPEAVAVYDKLMYRPQPRDPYAFAVSGTFRAAALLKYTYALRQVGRVSDALRMYHMTLADSEFKDDYDGVTFNDVHLADIDEDNLDSSDLAMGVALFRADEAKAIPYLQEVTRRRPYLAAGHFYLGCAIHNATSASPEYKNAIAHTSAEAEFKAAAQTGSGVLKERAALWAKL